jgi:high-affinity nickel-transport protein
MKEKEETVRRVPPLIAVVLAVVVLLLTSWGLFFGIVLPGNYVAGTTTFGVGLAVTAFVIGMRHAFDADHITAIDNTTRKLIGERKDASTVGLWFAIGHSAVVLGAVALISGGLSALTSQLGNAASPLALAAGIWGGLVSCLFLLIVGSVNLVALIGLLRRRRTRLASADDSLPGGVVMRGLGRAGRSLDRPWKMLIVGFLFGLGFDTASTIALLLIAGGAGIVMPWYASMVLPLLFTAGIVMCDGINGLVMSRAYAWTTGSPRRRIYYNVTLMGISVIAAFLVGIVGLCGVLVSALHTNSGPVRRIADTNLESFGFIVFGILLAAWAVSYITLRARRTAVPSTANKDAIGRAHCCTVSGSLDHPGAQQGDGLRIVQHHAAG